MVLQRAVGGVRSRAAFIKPAELFRYLGHILAAQNVENTEHPHSFQTKMYRSRDKASNVPTPEFWEEFKQFLPQELKQTLGGQDFCLFFCDIAIEDDAEEAVREGMVLFASAEAKERLINSPHWMMDVAKISNIRVDFFKQVI